MPIPSGLAAEIDACAGRTYRAFGAVCRPIPDKPAGQGWTPSECMLGRYRSMVSPSMTACIEARVPETMYR